MIEIFDEMIPLSVRNSIYKFIINSNYRIEGWTDTSDLELKNHHHLHSRWGLEDIQNSQIVPYVEKVLQLSSFKDYTMKDFLQCAVNLVKPGDHYFTHSHDLGVISIIYYANLQWQHNWAGETIFYKENMTDIELAASYVPGRFIIFDKEPHTIRPQSSIAPAFRFTLAIFFQKKK